MSVYQEPVVFADLDDTLFQTPRKMSEAEIADADQATISKVGKHSFMTRKQANMVDWLSQTTHFIPVTARSSESFATVQIPFKSWAVLSNGGVILEPGGEVCSRWHELVAAEAEKRLQDLLDIEDLVKSFAMEGVLRHWHVEEGGQKIYFCVKSNAETQQEQVKDLADVKIFVETMMRACLDDYFVVHSNGNNLSFTPKSISKRAAVRYVCEKLFSLRERPIFGMGDSLTDLPFMSECDFLAIPKQSQVAKSMEIFNV